jgi:hypothetical protein
MRPLSPWIGANRGGGLQIFKAAVNVFNKESERRQVMIRETERPIRQTDIQIR